MAIEDLRQSKVIGTSTYLSQPVPFGKGLPALVRLVKIVAPIMSGYLKGYDQASRVAELLSALPGALSGDDVTYFADLFGPSSFVVDDEGREIPLLKGKQETWFAGKYLEFMQWLLFNLTLNFADFFRGLSDGRADVGSVLGTAKPPTES